MMRRSVTKKFPWLRQLSRMLDTWSVPHFLFGMVTAMAAIAFHWPLFSVFVLMIVIAFGWEYVERWLHIHEAAGNPAMDIILPVLAFGITLLMIDQAPFLEEQHIGLFVTVTGLFLFVNAAAWKARLEHDRDFLK